MIKAIFFDLGGTLVPFDFQRGYAALARHSPHGPEEILRRAGSSDLFVRFERGELEPRQFVSRFCELFDCRLDFERFRQLWGAIFLPHALIGEPLLAGLKKNYRLFSLSNTNALHFPLVMQEYPILRYLEGHVLSYEVGAMKPEPEIYRAAGARAGCHAAECLFIDDLAENIEGARREGMDGILFRDEPQLRQQLANRALLF